MDEMKKSKYPKELFAKMSEKLYDLIQIFPEVNDYDAGHLMTTFFVVELGRVIEATKTINGVKMAKQLRQTLCERIHAYPLDEKESNDVH